MANITDKATAALMKAAQRVDSVVNAMTGLGGLNDKGSQVAVDTSLCTMSPAETQSLGRHDGYVVKWLERYSQEATQAGWEVKVGADTQDAFKRFEVYAVEQMGGALRSALLDGGALVLMVTDDGQSLATPMNLSKVTEVKALHVFDNQEFEVAEYETDYREKNWRRARYWQISPATAGITRSRVADPTQKMMKVHHSRCLYIRGRKLSDRLWFENGGKDDSYLDAVWDSLKDLRQVDQGLAVLAQEMQQSVIKMKGLEGVDASALTDVMRGRLQTLAASKGLLNLLLLSDEDEYETRSAVTTGAQDLKGSARATWAATTGQPEVVAFGATPGGLNTDGEAGRRAWDRELVRLQKSHLLDVLTRLYEVYAASIGFEGDWRLEFRDLGTLTPMERAQVNRENAMTDRIYRQEGVLTPEHIRVSRFSPDGPGPIRPVPANLVAPADPSRALSGPQQAGVTEVQLQVATKRLAPEEAIENLVACYNFDRTVAELMIGKLGTAFTVDPEIAGKSEKAEGPDSVLSKGNTE